MFSAAVARRPNWPRIVVSASRGSVRRKNLGARGRLLVLSELLELLLGDRELDLTLRDLRHLLGGHVLQAPQQAR